MSTSNRLVSLIKQASTDANDMTKPAGIYYGTVKSASPLEVEVEQRMTLKAGQLIVPQYLTDYSREIELEWQWSEGGDITSHPVITKKTKVTYLNALEEGDEIILLRAQGGQQYLVLDRQGS